MDNQTFNTAEHDEKGRNTVKYGDYKLDTVDRVLFTHRDKANLSEEEGYLSDGCCNSLFFSDPFYNPPEICVEEESYVDTSDSGGIDFVLPEDDINRHVQVQSPLQSIPQNQLLQSKSPPQPQQAFEYDYMNILEPPEVQLCELYEKDESRDTDYYFNHIFRINASIKKDIGPLPEDDYQQPSSSVNHSTAATNISVYDNLVYPGNNAIECGSSNSMTSAIISSSICQEKRFSSQAYARVELSKNPSTTVQDSSLCEGCDGFIQDHTVSRKSNKRKHNNECNNDDRCDNKKAKKSNSKEIKFAERLKKHTCICPAVNTNKRREWDSIYPFISSAETPLIKNTNIQKEFENDLEKQKEYKKFIKCEDNMKQCYNCGNWDCKIFFIKYLGDDICYECVKNDKYRCKKCGGIKVFHRYDLTPTDSKGKPKKFDEDEDFRGKQRYKCQNGSNKKNGSNKRNGGHCRPYEYFVKNGKLTLKIQKTCAFCLLYKNTPDYKQWKENYQLLIAKYK